MSTKYAIYSPNTVDGVCASAALVRFLKLRRHPYKIADISFQTIDADLNTMKELKGHFVVILDFPPDSITELDSKLKEISANNRIIYWNSHHPYTKEILEVLKKYVQIIEMAGPIGNTEPPKTLCSTDLVCDRFMKFEYICQTLKEIAHDYEFWIRKDERGKKIADLIASGYDKKDLIESLALGIFWSDKFGRLHTDYMNKREKELNQILKKIVVKDYGGVKIAFAISNSLISTTDAGNYVLENNPVDVSVIIYKDGRISFRRRDGVTVNLKQMAELFNGGGHVYAAGGNLLIGKEVPVRAVSSETFDTIMFYIDRKLSDWFYK